MKVFALSVIVSIALGGCSSATPIAITNNALAPIEDVSISGSGFSQTIGSIAPGRTSTTNVQPTADSGLVLSFRSGSRHIRTEPLGYFEGGGAYKVKVVVARDLTVTVDGGLKY